MKVEIKDVTIDEINGTSKQGRPYHIRKQTGYVTLPSSHYPVRFQITLENNNPGYPVGVYTLEPVFDVDAYGSLKITRLALKTAAARSVA